MVGVAIMDTGVYRHTDFYDRIVGFADFVNYGEMNKPYDDNGHGTHVAGIIAGNGKASKGRYRGIAPEAGIIGVKVLDRSGNGQIENVLNGAEWIKKNSRRLNIRVVNISFGTKEKNNYTKKELDDREALILAVESMWDMGIVVVCAAGNNGPKPYTVTVPGIAKKIITVGAFDDKKFFSGRGPTRECVVKPELIVTGSNIIACSNKADGYVAKSGTSMAAPIVSGAIARLLKDRPELTPKEVKLRLKNSCTKKSLPDNLQGWGVLDMEKFITL